MMRIELELTREEVRKLCDVLASAEDEGPPREGWKSGTLECIIGKLEEACAKAERRAVSIVLVPSAVRPHKHEPWSKCAALLLNPCDGYHQVYARFDGEGEFDGFYDFAGSEPYADDFYVAWSLLPDELPLIYTFSHDRKPLAERFAIESKTRAIYGGNEQ